jgi:hypothetical protein
MSYSVRAAFITSISPIKRKLISYSAECSDHRFIPTKFRNCVPSGMIKIGILTCMLIVASHSTMCAEPSRIMMIFPAWASDLSKIPAEIKASIRPTIKRAITPPMPPPKLPPDPTFQSIVLFATALSTVPVNILTLAPPKLMLMNCMKNSANKRRRANPPAIYLLLKPILTGRGKAKALENSKTKLRRCQVRTNRRCSTHSQLCFLRPE